MSIYPPAIHQADNASLRPHYGTPMQLRFRGVPDAQGNKGPGRYVLFENYENLARYNALYDLDPNPPTTDVEAYERCGATFFPHCSLITFKYKTNRIVLWLTDKHLNART